jgi:hypothetical protein
MIKGDLVKIENGDLTYKGPWINNFWLNIIILNII